MNLDIKRTGTLNKKKLQLKVKKQIAMVLYCIFKEAMNEIVTENYFVSATEIGEIVNNSLNCPLVK